MNADSPPFFDAAPPTRCRVKTKTLPNVLSFLRFSFSWFQPRQKRRFLSRRKRFAADGKNAEQIAKNFSFFP